MGFGELEKVGTSLVAPAAGELGRHGQPAEAVAAETHLTPDHRRMIAQRRSIGVLGHGPFERWRRGDEWILTGRRNGRGRGVGFNTPRGRFNCPGVSGDALALTLRCCVSLPPEQLRELRCRITRQRP